MEYINLPEQEIINYYLNGISMTQLAKQYKVSRYVITDRLQKYNITQFNHGYFLRKCKNINEHYFDVIDTEKKAYFLGLLFADGCNHRNDRKEKFSIALQEGDKKILEKFSQAILGDIDLYFLKKRKSSQKNQWRLTVHSRRISDKLASVGCIARKSLKLLFPEWLVDPELQRHFIRGYFDGDGSVSNSKRKGSKNTWDYASSLVSTKNFCLIALSIIKQQAGINVLLGKPSKNGITTKLYVKGNRQIMKFLDWLYKDSTVFLDRKYEKYLELKLHRTTVPHRD